MTGMGMRGIGGAAGLLVVAGTLIATPINAQAIAGLNTVTVSPSHGKAAAQFQVTYAISPCQHVGFSWNGLTPAGQVLGTAATDTACRATLTTKPPLNAAHQPPAPGSYQVFGYLAPPTGAPAPNAEASTTFTVDVTPAPSAGAKETVLRFLRGLDWWTLIWPVVTGISVLVLAILAAMGFSLLMMLSRWRVRAAAGPSKDKAA